jgi:hypothetical protein
MHPHRLDRRSALSTRTVFVIVDEFLKASISRTRAARKIDAPAMATPPMTSIMSCAPVTGVAVMIQLLMPTAIQRALLTGHNARKERRMQCGSWETKRCQPT